MSQTKPNALEFAPELDHFGRDNGNNSDMTKYKSLANEYFGETDENRQEAIHQFREKLESEDPHLLKSLPGTVEDHFLLKVLRAGTASGELEKLDVAHAAKLLKNFTGIIQAGPKYFIPAFEQNHSLLKTCYVQQALNVLTHRDKYGRRVFIIRAGSWNPDKVEFTSMFAAGYAMLEMIALEEKTQIAGLSFVVDGSNFGYNQFKNMSFEDLKYFASFGQDHFPLWIRQAHLINFPRFLKLMFEMVKPLLYERARNKIVIHNSNESLHEYIDKTILPEEYGGPLGKFDNSECAAQVYQIKDYLLEIQKYVLKSTT